MIRSNILVLKALLVMALGLLLWQPASAGMIGTPALLAGQPQEADIQARRQSIETQLVELGVEPTQAAQRVARLSDAQINDISGRLADQPAGASVGGVLLTVFIVFVITDVIGATDIFPFIKPVK